MTSIIFKIFFSILLFYHVDSANILGLFPCTVRSHFMVFEPYLKRLAERGHNMTLVSFYPMKDPPPNVREISLQGIDETRLEHVDLSNFENEHLFYKIPLLGRIAKGIVPLHTFAISNAKICERLIDFKPLLEVLNREYDLVVAENFMGDCALALYRLYGGKAPIVALVSGTRMPWTVERVAAVDNPSYVPIITSVFKSEMSFMERLENTLLHIGVREWYYREITMKDKNILEKRFGSIPDLIELSRNTSMMFLNTFHVLNGALPLVPGLVEVGGMHLSPGKKTLPQYIERFLNESEHGVVLFSLGSHVKTMSMPKYKEEMFINALSKLKQRVVWKYEGSGPEGTRIGNILRVRWLPQYELLQHEKIIAFITHGGMLGMTESLSEGKPMVVIPIFADQHLNAAAAAEAGVAVVLSYVDLSEQVLTSALKTVLSAEMVSKTRKVSKMWHDRESSPLDTAVYHTERIIRWGHDAKLYTKAKNLPFYKLALIDVALTILFFIVMLFTVLYYIVRKILKLFFREINFIGNSKTKAD